MVDVIENRWGMINNRWIAIDYRWKLIDDRWWVTEDRFKMMDDRWKTTDGKRQADQIPPTGKNAILIRYIYRTLNQKTTSSYRNHELFSTPSRSVRQHSDDAIDDVEILVLDFFFSSRTDFLLSCFCLFVCFLFSFAFLFYFVLVFCLLVCSLVSEMRSFL